MQTSNNIVTYTKNIRTRKMKESTFKMQNKINALTMSTN